MLKSMASLPFFLREKCLQHFNFFFLHYFVAGADSAKKLLREIVILPYLRPEVHCTCMSCCLNFISRVNFTF